MPDPDALIAFLKARLDEEEWIAQGAARTDDGHEGHWLPVHFGVGGFDARVDDHIALHDPARALREVAIKQARLSRYLDTARNAAERRAEGRSSPAVEMMRDTLYVEVLHDAALYDGHPAYLPEWKP